MLMSETDLNRLAGGCRAQVAAGGSPALPESFDTGARPPLLPLRLRRGDLPPERCHRSPEWVQVWVATLFSIESPSFFPLPAFLADRQATAPGADARVRLIAQIRNHDQRRTKRIGNVLPPKLSLPPCRDKHMHLLRMNSRDMPPQRRDEKPRPMSDFPALVAVA
jgi:hypothetical protein